MDIHSLFCDYFFHQSMLVIYLNTTVNSFQGSYGASFPPQGCASAIDFIITEICFKLHSLCSIEWKGNVMA